MKNIFGKFDQSSPEGVVKAPQGAKFFRNGEDFFLDIRGNLQKLNISKKAFIYEFYSSAGFTSLKEEYISFSKPNETWIKRGEGNNKTGWVSVGSYNLFTRVVANTVPIFGNIIGAWAGTYSSYLLNTKNELWSTGYNDSGQLGIGNTNYRESASLSLADVKLAASSCEGYFAGAVKNDNTLWFTGYGGNGSFGNGTYDSYSTWTETVLEGDITGSGAITNLVTGDYYSALLMQDGTVWVSTDETFGLGATTFTQVATNVKAISGGGYHLLYIKNDNTLWGIGDNWDNQLGSDSQPYYAWDEPYQIASNVASCAAMGYHSAYIDTNGTLFTFGDNGSGQLGTSYGYDDFSVATPQQIDTDVKFVGGGDDFTYYIKNDGTLYGMGNGNDGQLSDKYEDDVIEPIVIDTNVSYAVGGNEFGLYIKSDKTLYGMGYNYYWQLGNYALPFAMYYTEQTGWTTEGIDKFIFTDNSSDEIYWSDSIYANGKFIAGGGEGLTQIRYSTNGKNWTTGSIQDVGAGISGIAYNGTDTYVAVSDVSDEYNDGRPEVFTSSDGITWTTGSLNNTSYDGLSRVRYVNGKFIAVGEDRIVTSSNGTDWVEQSVAFPSYNTSVAYGNGKYVISTGWGDYNSYGNKNQFAQTFDGNTASYASLGDGHAMVLKDGTLYGVGRNYNNQLGLDSSLGNFIKFVPVSSNVKSVASGRYNTTFVKNDGTLYGMGSNYNGQLGDGTRAEIKIATQIDTNVSQSFSGMFSYDNTVYIKNNGTLWGMGANYNGQLGEATLNSIVTASIQLDTDVVYASIGGDYILYVKSNGNLYGIGYNGYGQLGTGDYNDKHTASLIDTNVVSCIAGSITSFYIKNDGTLYGMGYNAYGQLGIGGDYNNQITPVMITGSVEQVSAGYGNASFITNDGTLYSMGDNGSGQLGVGDYTNYNVPTIAAYNVSNVICGNEFTYIIKNDGTVLSTGYNDNNRLGIVNTCDKIMYSTDATTWHTASAPDYWYNDVVFGNGKFVMVSGDDSFVISSTDAINWTSSYVNTGSYVALGRVIYDGTKFVTSAYHSDDGYNIYTSTDAVTWTKSTTGYNNGWGTIAHGDGKYVLLSYGWETRVNPKVKLNIG